MNEELLIFLFESAFSLILFGFEQKLKAMQKVSDNRNGLFIFIEIINFYLIFN